MTERDRIAQRTREIQRERMKKKLDKKQFRQLAKRMENVFNQKSDFQYVTNCPFGFYKEEYYPEDEGRSERDFHPIQEGYRP